MNRTRLKTMLVKHEALKLKLYRCTSGKLTIGVGRNIEDRGIRECEAMLMLDNDIAEAHEACQRLYPGFDALDEARQHALIDMMFNMGETTLRTFKKMNAAIDAREWEKAADCATDSDWYGQVGQRSKTVVRMLRTGEL